MIEIQTKEGGERCLVIRGGHIKKEKKNILLTRSRVIPSYQGDSIIFHNKNLLQLQGILSLCLLQSLCKHTVEVEKREKLPTNKEIGEPSLDNQAL